MKITRSKLKKIIENFLYEESEEDPAADDEEESEDELADIADDEPEEESEPEEEPEEESKEESDDEPEEESKEEPEKDPKETLEDALKDETPQEALRIVIGKLKAGDSLVLPVKIREILASVADDNQKLKIPKDEKEYNEETFTAKYGVITQKILNLV